jgi:CRP-like cAMP-binding protein
LTVVVVCAVSKEDLADLLRARPALAEELALILSNRVDAEKRLTGSDPLSVGQHASSLAQKIRHLFRLQHV